MHQLSFKLILEAIRALNAPAAYRFTNGQVLMGEARFAFVMGDQPAQDKVIGKKSKSWRIRVCDAPAFSAASDEYTGRHTQKRKAPFLNRALS